MGYSISMMQTEISKKISFYFLQMFENVSVFCKFSEMTNFDKTNSTNFLPKIKNGVQKRKILRCFQNARHDLEIFPK
jgi:hypothetical protein